MWSRAHANAPVTSSDPPWPPWTGETEWAVAGLGDTIVGTAWVLGYEGGTTAAIAVDPAFRNRGVGTALAHWVRETSGSERPDRLFVHPAPYEASDVEWAARRGAQPYSPDRMLDPFRADVPARYEAPRTRVAVDLVEDRDMLDDLVAAAHDVYCEGWSDLPGEDDSPPSSLEEWRSECLSLLDGGGAIHVVRAANNVLGFTTTRIGMDVAVGFVGMTAVARSHRGRGFAVTLKLAQLEWASTRNLGHLIAWIHPANEAMHSVARRTGWRRLPLTGFVLERKGV